MKKEGRKLMRGVGMRRELERDSGREAGRV